MTLLHVESLTTHFLTEDGVVKAVDRLDLEIREGETLGLIGETGCGKTVLGLSIMRLLPRNVRMEGEILYRGDDLLRLSEEEMRRMRGKEIALIPQNPSASLNPVLKVGGQISEAIELHQGLKRAEAWQKAAQLLKSFGLNSSARGITRYPHQLSRGMKQRVLVAMGIACNPSLVIADEPTKGLDAIVRAHVVESLRRLCSEKRALLLITHDLEVAFTLCDRIAVMYAGEIIELAATSSILSEPRHPYTRGLLNSLPSRELKPIPGFSPSLIDLPAGCKFHPRCDHCLEVCNRDHPEMILTENAHYARCFL